VHPGLQWPGDRLILVLMTRVMHVPRLDPAERLPAERDLIDEARQIFADADEWMNQEHPLLGGRTPRQCVAEGDEQLVWDLLRNIRYVGQT
jgi:hypothetical protein